MTVPTPLPERLRDATATRHRDLERSPFLRALLSGRVDRRAYASLLRNLHTIYEPLERSLTARAAHPALAPIYDPALQRQDALERDLQHLHGPAWPTELEVLAPAQTFGARLGMLAAERPERLVAHAYVRYLGDLSGGQLLRTAVSRSLGLNGGEGLAFYDFGPPPRVAELSRRFRAGLACIPDVAGSHDAIVDEAIAAFEAHRLLFDTLAAHQREIRPLMRR